MMATPTRPALKPPARAPVLLPLFSGGWPSLELPAEGDAGDSAFVSLGGASLVQLLGRVHLVFQNKDRNPLSDQPTIGSPIVAWPSEVPFVAARSFWGTLKLVLLAWKMDPQSLVSV